MRKTKGVVIAVAAFVAVLVWLVIRNDPRTRAEREHGITLPLSAHNIQCKGDAWRGFLDRGAATMFEMSTNEWTALEVDSGELRVLEWTAFVSQLHVKSRRAPRYSAGDSTATSNSASFSVCAMVRAAPISMFGYIRNGTGDTA